MTEVGLQKGCVTETHGVATPLPASPLSAWRQIQEALSERDSGYESPVFVDFDHTLFSCNSTELFIASCKPSMLVAVVDFIVRQCMPWRLTGLANWFRLRDFARFVIILMLFPWNIFIWRRIAPGLFDQYASRDISDGLAGVDPRHITIVSFGMEAIIRPLVRRSRWERTRLIATPVLTTPGYFAHGKLSIVLRSYTADIVSKSTFISDSLDDSDLLTAARAGILVKPQGDLYHAAEHLYLPLRYTVRAKYSFSYAFDQIFLVELLLALICTAASLSGLITELLFVPFLTISLMCVYEIGYFENDMVAAKFEATPTLGKHVDRFRTYPIEPAAWVWAVVLGVLGSVIAWHAGTVSYARLSVTIPLWFAALISLRFLFYIYNKPPVRNRLLLYPVLQIMKYLPIFLIVPPTMIGAVLIICQIATMWVLYLTYRVAGNPTKTVEKEVFRTILFSLALGLSATALSVADLGGWFPVIAMGVWSVARLVKAPILRALRGTDQVTA